MDIQPEDYQLIVESAIDHAIFILDTGGHIRSWNPGAQRIKQYTRDEIVGKHFSIFHPPHQIESGWPAHELKMALEVGRFEDEGWRIRKDGTQFWANIVITRLVDAAGRHRGFSKITRDLTERRQQEDLLRQSEERFRLLVESVTDYAIFQLDTEGCVRSWNVGAEKNKGYKSAEIIGKHFSIFYPKEIAESGRPNEKLRVALEQGRFEDEGWRVRKDGSRFWASVVITPIRSPAGEHRGCVKVTRDLTERKKVSELQDEGRRITTFLAMLGHELRSPLAPITNAANLLERSPDANSVQLAHQIIGRQAQHMTRLVDDLLDVGRITSGRIHLETEVVRLRDVLRDAMEAMAPQIEARQHSVNLKVKDSDLWVKGDRSRLVQIVSNLIGNAAKFTPPEGRITVGLSRNRGLAEISVADNGPGIPPAELETVFGLFVQGKQETSRPLGGLGLGLSLVQQLAALHGGEVLAFSTGQPGQGAEFIVRLPLTARPEGMTTETRHEAAGNGKRILIADDNVDSALSIQMLIQSFGYNTTVVHDGEAAVKSAVECRPDAMLIDIGLPSLSGLEVASRLRELMPVPPLMIAVTGYGLDSDRQASEAAGFTAHMVKPVDFNALCRVLQERLQLRS